MDEIRQIKVNELPLASTLTGLEVLGFNATTNEAVRAAIALLKGLDGKPIELQKTTTHIQWRIQGGDWSNLIALSDIKGEKGDTGDVGTPNSLSIGTVTSGSTPSATITGLSPNQTLNLVLPKGDIGPKGDKGDTGAKGDKGDTGAKGEKGDTGAKGEKGDTGPSNTLSIGTVTGGIDASASITGIAPNQTLNLVLPKGDKGDKGEKGDKGDKGDTGIGVPTGGVAGQQLMKKSNVDYDFEWETPAGAGDMLTSVYDSDGDGVVDNAEKVNNHTVEADVPAGAKFTDTTYEEITEAEINTGTASTLRTITARRVTFILSKVSTLISNAISALTKNDVGLGNVDNTSDADKPVSTAQQAAIDSGVSEAKTYADGKFALAIPLTQKGAASGVAELDSSGKVLSSQLPSYVDDVLSYTTQSSFPATGESGKIYIAEDTNKTYRWTGSAYVEISPSIALGETSSTAYRGDRGKVAYDHSQAAHAPSNAQKNSDITKAEIEAKLTGAITTHTHAYVGTSGNETIDGTKTFSTIPVLPNSDPSSDNQAARKKYVDDGLDAKIDASKFKVVTELPESPTTGVFYFVKE